MHTPTCPLPGPGPAAGADPAQGTHQPDFTKGTPTHHLVRDLHRCNFQRHRPSALAGLGRNVLSHQILETHELRMTDNEDDEEDDEEACRQHHEADEDQWKTSSNTNISCSRSKPSRICTTRECETNKSLRSASVCKVCQRHGNVSKVEEACHRRESEAPPNSCHRRKSEKLDVPITQFVHSKNVRHQPSLHLEYTATTHASSDTVTRSRLLT